MGNDLLAVVKELLKYYRFNTDEYVATKALSSGLHPLGILVSIILSQNTSDKNALRALNNLRKALGSRLGPEELSKVDLRTLENLIRPAGMFRIKARAIMNVVKRFGGNNDLMSLEPTKLRKELLSIQGIGPKTADVFLLMVRNYPTFPIDTHIRRVLSRLGFVEEGSDYEVIRRVVMDSLPPRLYLPAHLVLIKHGRTLCRARNPKCLECPVLKYCRYGRNR